MSLDIYLYEECEEDKEPDQIHCQNITHNLGQMAAAAGIYHALWRPEEHGYIYAKDISEIIGQGIQKMQAEPNFYKTFDAKNGWGTYDQFFPWLIKLYAALVFHPNALLRSSV